MSEEVKELEPYQQRVVEEHRQLKIKADALNQWLNSRAVPSGLSVDQRLLMELQGNVMQLYAEILARRISLF